MKLILSLILISSVITAFSQTKVIQGKAVDAASNAPLEGVTIKVKNQTGGTTSAADGSFQITVNNTDVLEVSYVGYTTQIINAKGITTLTVNLLNASSELTDIVVTGSRGAPRSNAESAVPVDVIRLNSLAPTTAKPDLMSQLNMSVPSFNYNKQSGGDGSDAIDFASLRGLGFDQTLVLINGKRRHLSAFVNEVGTRGRGNSGTDLNAIPEATIDHIEVLRDGASAQYGSDAIAGVINIILKKDINKVNITVGESGFYDYKYNTLNSDDPSQYYTGTRIDGKTFTFGIDYGLRLGKNGGFINFGGNFMDQGKTFRAVPDTNWKTNSDALAVSRERRAFGDGSVTSGGGMYNMEIPLGTSKTTFYSFGGYNYKHSNVYAYTRSWNYPGRTQPSKFPTDGRGNLIFVPSIMRVLDLGNGSIGPDNVYYNPQEDVYITDISDAIGFKGTIGNGWDWDISNNFGYNDFHYYGNKTFNAALPVAEQATKTRFNDGGFNFMQNTANLDVTKLFNDVAQGFTFSFGGEFRYERYKLYAGEPDSYNGTAIDILPNGDTLQKNTGSEGYPGYQPSDAVTAHRSNIGGYIDGAINFTKNWLVDGAARFENYSDFGFVNTYKIATRYKVASNFNIRASASTGFRAPTLQQINFSNTNTTVIGSTLVYTKLVPNYSDVAKAANIPKLTQETSRNLSAGFTWKPVRNLTLTLDGYIIAVKNRIVITGLYAQGDPTLGDALNNLLVSNGIADAQFFANAVNTTNKGIDIVADYTKRWGKNHFTALLAGNLQQLVINKINIPSTFKGSGGDSASFFSDREQYFLKASAPRSKFALQLEYGINNFTIGSHLTYFGKVSELGFGETSAPATAPDPYFPYVLLDNSNTPVREIFNFKGKATTDVYVSYKFNKVVSWTIGVDNLFNVHPDRAIIPGSVDPYGSSSFGDSESGGPFEAVQMGFNGLRVFTKLGFNF